MALRTSTCLHFFLSKASRIAAPISLKIPPYSTTTTTLCNQFRYDLNLLRFTRKIHPTFISINESLSSSSPPSHEGQHQSQKPPPETISDVEDTKREVRTASNNVTVGDSTMNDLEKGQISLDDMVNSYPAVRRFIAIGSGGDEFADAMVMAVESVLEEPIPDARVKKRVSSMGRYISVNIGPVQVISRDQVKAVYEAMMKDARMRYFF